VYADEEIEASAALFADLMTDGNCHFLSVCRPITTQTQDIAALSLSGGEAALIPEMARAILKAGIFAAGEYYTATNDKGEIVGFAMWMPPGQEMFSTSVASILFFDRYRLALC